MFYWILVYIYVKVFSFLVMENSGYISRSEKCLKNRQIEIIENVILKIFQILTKN